MAQIYAIIREDLKKVYVGQSWRTARRIVEHRTAKTYYVYEELWIGDVDPEVIVLQSGIQIGPLLDQAEDYWMESVKDAGWTLINRSPPGARWGSAEQCRAASKIGAPLGFAASNRTHESMAAAMAKCNAKTTSAQKATAGRKGGVAGRGDSKSAQGYAQVQNLLDQYACDECSMITNGGGLTSHQRRTGHIGRSKQLRAALREA